MLHREKKGEEGQRKELRGMKGMKAEREERMAMRASEKTVCIQAIAVCLQRPDAVL